MDVRTDGWRAATWRERLRIGPCGPATAGPEDRHTFWCTHRWAAADPHRVADRVAVLGTDPDVFKAMLDEAHAGFVERAGAEIPAWPATDELAALLGLQTAPPSAGRD